MRVEFEQARLGSLGYPSRPFYFSSIESCNHAVWGNLFRREANMLQNPCFSNWLVRAERGRNPRQDAVQGSGKSFDLFESPRVQRKMKNLPDWGGQRSQRWPKEILTLRSKMVLGWNPCCHPGCPSCMPPHRYRVLNTSTWVASCGALCRRRWHLCRATLHGHVHGGGVGI